jgi:hypothetical protein
MHLVAYKILAAVLLFLLPASLLCPTLLATTPGIMLGHCHGHHEPASHPAHSCCYSKPQPPAELQMAPSTALLNIQTLQAGPVEVVSPPFAIVALAHIDASPPARLILRI